MRGLIALLVLVGCDGDTDEVDGDPCEGAGDPVVTIGDGGQDGFTAWAEGEAVSAATGGFRFEILTEGLDTVESVTMVARLTVAGNSDDALAAPFLTCDGTTGHTQFQFNLVDTTYTGPATFSVTVTDQYDDSATGEVEIEIQ